MSLRVLSRFVLAALLGVTATATCAQAWPTKPVRLVLQFPPGGSTDVVARILAQTLTPVLGQPVVVENRPGADGAIAGEHVARSEPDGHTFFVATNTPMMQVPLLKKNPPYDPVKSFTPVSLMGRYIFVLVVNSQLPARDVAEFLAHARANPGKLAYGSYSGVTHLLFHNIRNATKVDMNLVNYKGEGPTVTDLLGGHVQAVFATPVSALPHLRENRLRALTVMLPARTPLLPNVPTLVEAGLPPFNPASFAALYGPARLPADVANRMSREFNAAMKRPEVREKVDALGFELGGSTPSELANFTQEQLLAWGKAYRDAGMQPE